MSTIGIRRSLGAPGTHAVIGFLQRALQRRARRITLLELSRLDPRLLDDMGLEPQDIYDALRQRAGRLTRRSETGDRPEAP